MLFAPDDGKMLGGQVLGWDEVDGRLEVLAVALRAGMTVSNHLRGDIDLWYPRTTPSVPTR